MGLTTILGNEHQVVLEKLRGLEIALETPDVPAGEQAAGSRQMEAIGTFWEGEPRG